MQFNPVMQSPLHHFNLTAKAVSPDDSLGLWANEIALLGYINLRGNPQNAAFIKATKNALGMALPVQPCTLEYAAWGAVLWLAPDEWLIVCERTQRAELQAKLEAALTGIHAQVVDNSGGYTSLSLQGRHANDTLQHCTVYDLHALTANKVVGTTFGKASTLLYRTDDGYCLVFRRSFADYIWRYMEHAAQPYGFGIATS